MHTHNQISLTRKALYGIMLLGVFLSAFGGGNLPPVRAQEAGTESPTVTPTTVIGPIDTSTEESDTEVGSLSCIGGFSASQINSYLSCYGSPLNGWGGDFYSAGQYYNVDPRLAVAIAGAESSFGKNGSCATGRHNAWGYGGGWPDCWPFSTWGDGIWQVTWQLNNYIYTRGLTNIHTIGQRWCGSGCTYWESNVRTFYAEQGGNPDTNDLSFNGGTSCYALTQAWTGNGNEPTASPANSSGCSSRQYHSGESISLTAHPASGWHLDHWNGTDSSSSSHLTMPSSSHTVVANYVQDTLSCNPNADQVALFVDANYSGACVVKGIGNYPDPGAMGIANDAISSIKVGSNVKLTLCFDSNYGGTCEIFTGDDSNLSDNSIGNDQASSAKVETRGGSCTNGAIYAALQPGYTYCAGEGGVCSFGGQASVAYGADNCYFYQTFTSSVSCSTSVFNDPKIGTGKACHYKILTPAPSANFDAWPQSGTAPFTSAMHIVDTSNITSCSWNYGDGQTGTSCASYHNHTYNTAGTFTVSLTVSGPGGSDSMTRTNYISVTTSGDSYEPDNSSGTASWISSGSTQTHSIIPATDVDWVKFQLTSPSAITLETTGPTGYDTRMWLYDSSLSQIDYSDDEGVDNYSLIDRQCGVDALPAGTYYVKVDDYNNDNEIPSYNLSFNITQNCTPPSATFDAWPQSGNAPFTSTMHIVDTSNITSCSWNYGDGQTGTSCASTHDHTYNNAGTYTVSLTVSGPGGSDSMTRTNYITVSNPSPTVPPTPANFRESGTTTNSITLAWDDVSGETGYKIYKWGYDGSEWRFIYYASVGENVTSYTDTNLACGNDFNYYELSAYNGYGESEHHPWIQGVTDACLAGAYQTYLPLVIR